MYEIYFFIVLTFVIKVVVSYKDNKLILNPYKRSGGSKVLNVYVTLSKTMLVKLVWMSLSCMLDNFIKCYSSIWLLNGQCAVILYASYDQSLHKIQ